MSISARRHEPLLMSMSGQVARCKPRMSKLSSFISSSISIVLLYCTCACILAPPYRMSHHERAFCLAVPCLLYLPACLPFLYILYTCTCLYYLPMLLLPCHSFVIFRVLSMSGSSGGGGGGALAQRGRRRGASGDLFFVPAAALCRAGALASSCRLYVYICALPPQRTRARRARVRAPQAARRRWQASAAAGLQGSMGDSSAALVCVEEENKTPTAPASPRPAAACLYAPIYAMYASCRCAAPPVPAPPAAPCLLPATDVPPRLHARPAHQHAHAHLWSSFLISAAAASRS